MSRKVNFFIFLLTAIAALGVFVTSGAPIIQSLVNSKIAPFLYALSCPNTIIFNLSIGFLSSVIFWGLVVYIPEKSRRKLIRHTLARRYSDFKQEIVQIFIWASGKSETCELINQLAADHNKFKEYFDSNNKAKWYSVLNGIESNESYMSGLLLQMKMLSNELEYVLNNVLIDDTSTYQVFKILKDNISYLQESEVVKDERVKHVGAFLWQILARWNIIEGQLEDDIIEKMISRI